MKRKHSLEEYKKKRSFAKTPEPSPSVKKKSEKGPLSFVVHEHHASHLHWDLRLELDGVLKSWAVPKGPPDDPNIKRLAIHVEDHPLSYGTFEGTIPQGNYGAGEVYIWDKGAYSSESSASRSESEEILRKEFDKGHMRLLFAGSKLRGLYSLVKTKDNQWLFILKQKLGDSSMPQDISPMLAKSEEKPFDDPDWIFENKWDGYRIISRVDKAANTVSLKSRRGQDYTDKYEIVADELLKIKADVILDGEIIALDKDDKVSFQLLQDYAKGSSAIRYAVFDIIFLNGEDLRGLPLIKRKKILNETLRKSGIDEDVVFATDFIEENGVNAFRLAIRNGQEGIIAKCKDSIYESIRSDAWRKMKSSKRQEAIIAGFTEPKGGRSHFGSLILGAYEQGELKYIGNAGSGFDESTINALMNGFKKIIIDKCPFKAEPKTLTKATWIKPVLIAEIKFTEWTKDGRMRHPVFLGLRDDKLPQEVTIEKAVPTVDAQSFKKTALPDVTNPDKIFWPEKGYTKADLIEYYDKISTHILPYLKDRPLTLVRHPNGIDKESFYQKNFTGSAPPYLRIESMKSESKGSIRFAVCDNKESLLYLANLGCIEMNPWNSKVDSPDYPDYMIIDLDPVEESFDTVIEVARTTKEVLDLACTNSYIKTSGKRGLHILAPFMPKYDYDDVRTFCKLIVDIVHSRLPDVTSLERSPRKRKGKIYLDYLQNRRGQTLACPYSLRPTKDATVSAPLKWSEVKKGLDPSKFNIQSIFRRMKGPDPWKDFFHKPSSLEKSIYCLKKALKNSRSG